MPTAAPLVSRRRTVDGMPARLTGDPIRQVLLLDLHRLGELITDVAAGSAECGTRRAQEVSAYVHQVLGAVDRHLGEADALCGRLFEVSAAATALAPSREGPAAERWEAAAELAAALAGLHDAVARGWEVQPGARSVTGWAGTARELTLRDDDLSFLLPRLADAAGPDQWNALRAEAGPVLLALLAVVRPRFQRFQRLVFGA